MFRTHVRLRRSRRPLFESLEPRQLLALAPVEMSRSYYGGAGNEAATGIAVVDAGAWYDVYLSGVSNAQNEEGLVVNYNSPQSLAAPTQDWSSVWPGAAGPDRFEAVVATAGDVFAAGASHSRTTDTVGDKEHKGVTVRFPPAGAAASWHVQTPGAPGAFSYGGIERLFDIATVEEGGQTYLYATGGAQSSGINGGRHYVSKLTSAGAVLWTRTDAAGTPHSEGREIVGTSFGAVAAGFSYDSGSTKPYLKAYNADGSLRWTRTATTGRYDGLTLDESGGALYAVGVTGGSIADFLVDKWDLAGNLIWSRTFDRSSGQDLLNAASFSEGRLFAVGSTTGASFGGSDGVLLEIDPATGDLLSTTLWGGAQNDSLADISAQPGSLHVAATTRSFGAGGDDMAYVVYSTNQAPAATIGRPIDGFSGVRGQSRTFSLQASDSSPSDQAAGFTFDVDWGDGESQTISGASGLQLSHAYAAAGRYSVSLTATDRHGALSAPSATTLEIVITEQQGSTLAIGGTPFDDTIVASPASIAGASQVALNGVNLGVFVTPAMRAYGGDGEDAMLLTGSAAAETIVVGATTVALGGLQASGANIESWRVEGMGGNDSFVVAGGSLAADHVIELDGGPGSDSLRGGNAANSWTIDGIDAGGIDGASFASIENLIGGSKVDTFAIGLAGALSGGIAAGGGNDVIQGANRANEWTISAPGAGSLNGSIVFSQLETLGGGSQGDSFQLLSLAAKVAGAIGGGGGVDTLQGPARTSPNAWLVAANNGGTLNGLKFNAVENLVGGDGQDQFKFNSGKSVSGRVLGGAGIDTLDYSAFSSAVVVDLLVGKATGVFQNASTGIAGIERVYGGAGADQLTGDAADNWLVGNGGNDSLSGGAGNDVLLGGLGNDLLTGDADRDLLVGGSGADLATGGDGDDIVIGGRLAASLYDESSKTVSAAAVAAIMSEWTRSDQNYSSRVQHLHDGGGLNGAVALNSASVVDESASTADNLGGGDDADWFFRKLGSDLLADWDGMLPEVITEVA